MGSSKRTKPGKSTCINTDEGIKPERVNNNRRDYSGDSERFPQVGAFVTSSLFWVTVMSACQLLIMYDIPSKQAIALTKTNLSLFAVSMLF